MRTKTTAPKKLVLPAPSTLKGIPDIGGMVSRLTESMQPSMEKAACEDNSSAKRPIIVNVRWWDGYLEVFECAQVRQGGHIVWMRLTNGQNRTIPLTGNVRWFSTDPESHASSSAM